jgi:splicing factor 3A subunit 1
VLSQEAESKKRLDEANRIIREQGGTQLQVGPALPGQAQQQKYALTLPPPIPGAASEEPAAKRAKIVTYAPSILQQPGVSTAPIPTTVAALPVVEDPFAVAAAGTGLPTSVLDNQDLIPEAQFAASLPKSEMSLQIRVPNDPTQMAWNFYGQIVSISTNVMTQIKMVKSELSTVHLNGLPANKIQLKNPATGTFLKDNLTLAAHNISPSTTLELVPRARGGKKK